MKSFWGLLDALLEAPKERRAVVEQVVFDTFQRRKAVLALDMAGFTLAVRRDGVLPYLCQVRRMQNLTRPVVQANRGEIVKYEADNLLAVFDEPGDAVVAAIAMNRTAHTPADGGSPIAFSIGIDYGEMILIPGADCFGDAVNLAHKLGEDLAESGEILITERARERIGGSGPPMQPMPLSVAGVELVVQRVKYDVAEK